jgi:hypothetical protein
LVNRLAQLPEASKRQVSNPYRNVIFRIGLKTNGISFARDDYYERNEVKLSTELIAAAGFRGRNLRQSLLHSDIKEV